MKRLYPNRKLVASDEDSQSCLRKLYNKEIKMKAKLSEKDFARWIIGFHDAIRIIYELPDNIFSFVKNKDTNEIFMVTFDFEPGESYHVDPDEDGRHCITIDVPCLVEHEEEQDNGNQD